MERLICSSKPRLPYPALLSSSRHTGPNHLRCPLFPRPQRLSLSSALPAAAASAAAGAGGTPCNSRGFSDLVEDGGLEDPEKGRGSTGYFQGLMKGAASSQSLLKISSIVALSLLLSFAASPSHAINFSTAVHGGKRLLGSEILSSAGAGFFAGCLHTLSGPDHLVALAPLSIGRTRTESALVGALWGFGHDAGQVIFGLIFLLLKERLHLEVIDAWGTVIVGLTLLIIGALGIKEASAGAAAIPCIELSNQDNSSSAVPVTPEKKKVGIATFATGIIHGLQADALMMVLPALALPSRLAGASFLLMFLFGTVVSMAGYTVFICSCSQALQERVPRVTEKLTWGASLLAIFMGLAIVLGQFFGFSLF